MKNAISLTAAEFDGDPKAAYKLAEDGHPVTIIDSSGRPSMTIVIPQEDRRCCDAAEQLAAVTRELAELRTLLRDCEWPHVGGAEFNLIQCPSCRQIHEYTFEPEGGRTHKPDCKLAAALAAEKKT